MKKIVGIVTMQGNNFGNRLQSYALQEILRQNGLDTVTYKRKYYSDENKIKIFIASLLRWTTPLLNCKRLPNRVKESLAAALRIYNMDSFTRTHIKLGGYIEDLKENEVNIVDYFVCGSDQIWNPNFSMVYPEDFLSFSKREKNVSIAASLGVNELPPEKKDLYKKYLSNFKAISVREDKAKEILSEIIDQDIVVLADPTMTLKKDEWIKLERKVEIPSSYIVAYCLDNRTNDLLMKALNEIYENNVPKIVWLFNKKHPESYWYGPREFIYVIHNADAVYTDSFHGTVFSLIFGKNVRVFERYTDGYSMNSRINTLITKMGLDTEIIILNPSEADNTDIINYDKVSESIKNERILYERFIKKYLI